MLTIQNVEKAKKTISKFVQETPVVKYSEGIYLKLENLHDQVQAFKIRGAYNKFKSLDRQVKKVVTAAVGSYGFAVGVIGKELDVKTICFIPQSAPDEKKIKMISLVDEVIMAGDEFSETEKIAQEYATSHNLPFLHPYNDEAVIAGQGTIALEIIRQIPNLNNVYVPVGGGGLISGIGIVLKTLKPHCRIIGVQPSIMAPMASSFKAGKITFLPKAPSIAEPLTVNLNSQAITFWYVKKNVDEFITVTEEEIKIAMKEIYEKNQVISEGAGAVALAGLLKDSKVEGDSVCIVSGGNIDKEKFRRVVF